MAFRGALSRFTGPFEKGPIYRFTGPFEGPYRGLHGLSKGPIEIYKAL